MARPKPPPGPPGSPDDAEQQFYEALQQGDIDKLMAVWADDDDIACVHPGGARCIGAAAIRASFEAMFGQGAVDASAAAVRRVQTHACAVHSVLEQVRSRGADGPRSGWVVATNVYLKTAQGWRMASHHASPGTPHDADAMAEAGAVLH